MSYVPPLKFDTDTLAQMRQFWEDSDLSAKAIGKRFGVTKNVIVGQARRRGWKPRAPSPGAEPSNVFIRLDAVHAKLDAVLAETRPFVEGRKKVVIADPALVGIAAE